MKDPKTIVIIVLILILIVGGVMWAFSGKGKLNISSSTGTDNSGVIPSINNPGCDKSRPGYNVYGYEDWTCGSVTQCDPNKLGYNTSGFPDFNCGFARKK